MSISKEPNIFKYATSELSQDALICYILEFAKEEYFEHVLHPLGLQFVKSLSGAPTRVIKIHNQWNRIDVLVELENSEYILIEDKTNSSNHSDQLERYKIIAESQFPNQTGHFIYFKPMNDGMFHLFGHKDYSLYNRENFLDILNYASDLLQNEYHPILSSAQRIYKDLENRTNLWLTHPTSEWASNPCINDAWQGLFGELLKVNSSRSIDKQWRRARWTYTPQRNGGFYSFVWHFQDFQFEGTTLTHYLQFEYGKLCIKLKCPDKQLRHKSRNFYRSILWNEAAKDLGFERNGRVGTWMTVAAIKNAIPKTEDGLVDISALTKLMDYATEMLNRVQLAIEKK